MVAVGKDLRKSRTCMQGRKERSSLSVKMCTAICSSRSKAHWAYSNTNSCSECLPHYHTQKVRVLLTITVSTFSSINFISQANNLIARAEGNGPDQHNTEGSGPDQHNTEGSGPDQHNTEGSGPDQHNTEGSGPDQHNTEGSGPDQHNTEGSGPDQHNTEGSGPDQHNRGEWS